MTDSDKCPKCGAEFCTLESCRDRLYGQLVAEREARQKAEAACAAIRAKALEICRYQLTHEELGGDATAKAVLYAMETQLPPDGERLLDERADKDATKTNWADETTKTLYTLTEELARARAKFPDNRMLVDALGEELGEAAREQYPGRAGGREWLHVACVAIRLYMEGTPQDTTPVLVLFEAAECLGRRELARLRR